MSLRGIYKTDVVTCKRDALIKDVAKLMKDNHVGDVIVVDEANGMIKPVGMVTDRDIVLGAVCENSDKINSMKVEELMSPDLVTIDEDNWLFDALRKMRQGGVSRAPIVTKKGELCGILSASAIFRVLNEELTELSELSDRRKEFPQQAMKSSKGQQKQAGAPLQ